jgi:hypothetical protein
MVTLTSQTHRGSPRRAIALAEWMFCGPADVKLMAM